MGNAELLQVTYETGGIVETKRFGELQAIGSERDYGRHHALPIPACTDQGSRMDGGAPPQTSCRHLISGERCGVSLRFATICSASSPARHVACRTPSRTFAALSPVMCVASGATKRCRAT